MRAIRNTVLAGMLFWSCTAFAEPQIRGLNRVPDGLPTIVQSERDLPVIAQADVVVAGGGTAGVKAALRAAREGRSVILIEERNCLVHDAPSSKGAVHKEVAAEPRIRVFFFSLAVGVVTEGDRVCGVVIVNHAGRQVILADSVVDTTERLRSPAALETVTASDRSEVKELLSGPETGVRYPTLRQAAQRLPVTSSCDVVVVGGGTSGAFAAIAAARRGAKVVLVEILSNLGGTSSHRVNSYYWGVTWKSMLSEEVDKRIHVRPSRNKGGLGKFGFDGEAKMRVLGDLARKSGVEILFRTFGAGVVVEGNRVTGVVIENASGRQVILAKTIVDATGHGDLAAAAGAAFEKGRPKDGFLHEAEHGPMRDSTDAEDMSKYYLKHPSYALTLNIRESRRICGDYTLTFDDAIHGRRFPDTVVCWRSNYDSHFPHSANEEDLGQDWIAILGLFRKPILGEIPYRCLLPKGLENILVIGKAYSATHDALLGARMQRDLQHMGEAAGVAAAMASRADISPRAVSVPDLQAELVRVGVLPGERPAEAQTDPAELVARLGTKQSLDAMVELYRAGERAVPALLPVRNSTEAALLLGMLRQRESIPALLNVLARRDERTFRFSLKGASSRASVPAYYSAVILLGRFQAREAAGPIAELLRDPKKCPLDLASFAIAALGKIGDRSVVGVIKPYLEVSKPVELLNENKGFEQHWGVCTNAVRALAKLGDKSGVPVLIGLLDSDQALLRNHAQQLLEEIAGCSFGKDRTAWTNWWGQNPTSKQTEGTMSPRPAASRSGPASGG